MVPGFPLQGDGAHHNPLRIAICPGDGVSAVDDAAMASVGTPLLSYSPGVILAKLAAPFTTR